MSFNPRKAFTIPDQAPRSLVNGSRVCLVGRNFTAVPFCTGRFATLCCGVSESDRQNSLHLCRAKKEEIPEAPRSVGPNPPAGVMMTGSVRRKQSQ